MFLLRHTFSLFVKGITRKSAWLAARSGGDRWVSAELQCLRRPAVLLTHGKSLFEVAMNVRLAANRGDAKLSSCHSDVTKMHQRVRDNKIIVLCIAALLIYFLFCFFASPSARTCSQPAGDVQHADLSVSELGQAAHWQWRDPHLQAVLHRQKHRHRRGESLSSHP